MRNLVVVKFNAAAGETAVVHVDENGLEIRVSTHMHHCPDHSPQGLAEAIGAELDNGELDFALDLQKVRLMGADGWALLLRLRALVVEAGGSIVVVQPSPRILKVAEEAQLVRAFHFCDNLSQVRQYFAQDKSDRAPN